MAPPPIELPPLKQPRPEPTAVPGPGIPREPKPSRPTRPRLTRRMLEGKEPKPPGAGGWTPTKLQVHILSAIAAGAAAALDLASSDASPKAIGIAFGKAAVAYLITYFTGLSAGVRKVSE